MKKNCRKRRFRHQFEARKVARKVGLRAYPCPFCKGWHLTSESRQ